MGLGQGAAVCWAQVSPVGTGSGKKERPTATLLRRKWASPWQGEQVLQAPSRPPGHCLAVTAQPSRGRLDWRPTGLETPRSPRTHLRPVDQHPLAIIPGLIKLEKRVRLPKEVLEGAEEAGEGGATASFSREGVCGPAASPAQCQGAAVGKASLPPSPRPLRGSARGPELLQPLGPTASPEEPPTPGSHTCAQRP